MDNATEVAIVALAPGVVEVAKRVGLPSRYAGVAAIVAATTLVALRDLALDGGSDVARWLLAGIVYGLAAAGLYSQARQLPQADRITGDGPPEQHTGAGR